jgi:aryl-alcohol dehydrogenase-like predicted oxidoreductase
VVLSGASTLAQLEDNLHAVQVDLSDDDLASALGHTEDPAAYWAHRSGLPGT